MKVLIFIAIVLFFVTYLNGDTIITKRTEVKTLNEAIQITIEAFNNGYWHVEISQYDSLDNFKIRMTKTLK